MTCLHDLLKAQALQCNNCEKLLRKWGERSEMQESEVILLMEHVELENHIHDKRTLINQIFDGLRKG